MKTLPQNAEVIVVGAGTAGLAAAQALRNAGVETLVLESAHRIGGRCTTDTTTFSVPFDRGASWLHSAPINPLARLAEQRSATLHKTPWEWSQVQTEGYNLSRAEVDQYQQYHDQLWEVIAQRGAIAPDTTTEAAMPTGPWTDIAARYIPQMLGGDADVTSAEDTYNYAEEPGDWLIESGMGAFIQGVHKDVPVQLNCSVHEIDYTGKDIRVSTPMGALRAKYLILTVSTGVLAAEAIKFVPALPNEKTTAIEQLPNGLLNKVGIEFDPAWRGAGLGQMTDYHAGGDAYCSLQFGFYDSDLAIGFVGGRFASALENEGPGATTDFCMQALRALFGQDALSSVKRTDETGWHNDPNTFGAYSYAKPGGANARRILAKPIENKMFFAGEATMTHTYSTVHGAFQSGQRAAAQVISALSQDPPKTPSY
ncbi:MAG: NAD(P)/FAD-dependent oxidoreductase [Sulfitobacter sp.]